MRGAVLALILWAGAALAQTTVAPGPDYTGPRIAGYETGVLCTPDILDHAAAPGTISGYTNILDDVTGFTRPGRTVPGTIGVSFGALVQSGAGPVAVDMVIHHPPMGPTGAMSQTYTTHIADGGPTAILYSLETAEEVLLGRWTFEAWSGGDLLYRAGFDVVDPATVPDLAIPCGYENLLS